MESLFSLLKFWIVAIVLLNVLPVCAQRAKQNAATPAAALTAQTSAFLQQYVNKDGKMNYAAIQRDPD